MRSLEPSSGDGAAAGPATSHAGERAGLVAGEHKGHSKRDSGKSAGRRCGRTQFDVWVNLTDGMLPIGRYTVRQLMPHSISPIRSCR